MQTSKYGITLGLAIAGVVCGIFAFLLKTYALDIPAAILCFSAAGIALTDRLWFPALMFALAGAFFLAAFLHYYIK